jgi:hypothetical protein
LSPAAPRTWQRLGLQLLVGSLGGLVAGLATLLLFRLLYAASFALADTVDSMWAFLIFGIGIVISIVLSGLLGGLAGGVLSALILGRLWQASCRRLALWAASWMVGSAGTSFFVLGRGADPTTGMVASGWWLLLGSALALLFALIAPPRARN